MSQGSSQFSFSYIFKHTKGPVRNHKHSIMKAIFALLAICAVAYAKQPSAPCCCDSGSGCEDRCFEDCLAVFPETVGVCFEVPSTCWCFYDGCPNAMANKTNFVNVLKAH
ncbi:unnamed protein product [Darwinula stevensoni]|uniref:Uncharacterized protein n=1 Tax=Darwinula stevensoni TaxID=69355 RepID=A0A7R8ZYW3_9CRUS|nr:unnamed protein product [Darwinula stevensoni]CAG0882322.1 unnamed protein product [Darwinula stevensoni]